MAKKITETKAKKHHVAAGRIAAILITAFITVACFGTGCDWLPEDLFPSTHEHVYSAWETTEATCGKDGKKERSCIVCGEKESEVLPATGKHVYGAWTTTEEATCGEDGEKTRSCTVCGHGESEAIPATGNHTYGGWTVITEPVCGEAGEKAHSCTVCGHEESEDIPAIAEHDYTDWAVEKEATCGEDGKKTRSCNICGHEDFEVIPATGNHTMGADNICTVCGYNANPDTEFSIHFLELGNGNAGDCTLIKCGDTEVLIDAGSKRNSTATVKAYIDQFCDDKILEYVITTHAHEDHIAALVGEENQNNGVLYSYTIGTIIQFAGHKTTSKVYNDYVTAVNTAESKGTKVYTANQCYNETDGAKRQYYLDENHTVSFNILYNYYYSHTTSDENDYSVVTLLTQELASGNKHYLFTGDLEASGESKMVDYYSNKSNSKSAFDILPQVEIYKAGHHGSNTSSSAALLQIIQPKHVAVCCCCGQPEYTVTNANTFPTQDMINRVGAYTDKIYVTTLATNLPSKDTNGNYVNKASKGYTSLNGNIVFTVKGDELTLECSNNNTILKDTEWFKGNRTWPGEQ